ncbi:MAG: RNA polymerase sigma factor RpoH [Alphaproteobacteria bacterium]|nr:MAG: RNA polymerase sigma factor RpoH [Alphaproteobacteria bacterium]
MINSNTALIVSGSGLSRYLEDIKKFPMLSLEEEYSLAKKWVEEGCRSSAHRLVTSHLRLAAKIAMGYRGYGLPISEVVSEANVGLMQAVKRFDPEKGFRLATYAIWWIKANIQEYILKSWSLVKMGTTSAQKKLFFNLRKLKNKIGALEDGDLLPENVEEIARQLHVPEDDVVAMNRRMIGGDVSLNATIKSDGETEEEWQSLLADQSEDHVEKFVHSDETRGRRAILMKSLSVLNDREKSIILDRRLKEPPLTLEQLSEKHGISRERVRQIENKAIDRLKDKVVEYC